MSDDDGIGDESVARVGAVVLAAGSSRRFGAHNKLLADVNGVPLIQRVVSAISASEVEQIVVVTGHDADAIATALAGNTVSLVHNDLHEQGIAGSIRTGIGNIDAAMDGALVCLGDMPETEPLLINRLIYRFAANDRRHIVCPVLPDGSRRNPVLWPRRFFPQLRELSGDSGAKQLICDLVADVQTVHVATAKVFMDIDTPDALARYVPQRQSRNQ